MKNAEKGDGIMNHWSDSLKISHTKRQVFYSFCYNDDYWRVQQIRNIGVVDGNQPASPNKWEEIRRKGDNAIYKWIDENLKYRSCTIVLIGEKTHSRKFVQYEIEKSWELGMGVFGINIHGLEDKNGQTSNIGRNPFDYVKIEGMWSPSCTIDTYDAGYKMGNYSPYRYIASNISDWIESAIKKRKAWYPM